MELQQVVVVTGASAGVGRAVAHGFARRGARIGLLARNEEALNQVRSEIEELGGQALVVPTDVSSADDVEHAATIIEEHFGPIDVWVNNAMVSVFGPVIDTWAEEFRRVTEVTYLGYVYGTLAALRRMKPRDRGTIVQVGSALAYRAIPMQAAYCGAKHAVRGFSDSLRCELLHDHSGVRVTMVQLPAVNTPQFDWVKSRLPKKAKPVPPIFQPEVVAEGIIWAAQHARREVFLGGSTLRTIWGNKIAPWFGDFYLARKGIDAQQQKEPEDPERPNNLWQSVQGVHRMHGRFDGQARTRSLQVWCNTHRGVTLLAAAGVVTALAGLRLATKRWASLASYR